MYSTVSTRLKRSGSAKPVKHRCLGTLLRIGVPQVADSPFDWALNAFHNRSTNGGPDKVVIQLCCGEVTCRTRGNCLPDTVEPVMIFAVITSGGI